MESETYVPPTREHLQEVRQIFDTITGASHYVVSFKHFLIYNPEAFQAAKALADALKANKIHGA